MLTAERLKKLLTYDPLTGIFRRKINHAGRFAGSIVGCKEYSGYLKIMVDRKTYRAHRLAWLWMMDEWPKAEIDHKDLNRANNIWSNLREATKSDNHANMKIRITNKIGFKGVAKSHNKFFARLTMNRTPWHSCVFDNKIDAAICYNYHAVHLFGDYARINPIPYKTYSHD